MIIRYNQFINENKENVEKTKTLMSSTNINNIRLGFLFMESLNITFEDLEIKKEMFSDCFFGINNNMVYFNNCRTKRLIDFITNCKYDINKDLNIILKIYNFAKDYITDFYATNITEIPQSFKGLNFTLAKFRGCDIKTITSKDFPNLTKIELADCWDIESLKDICFIKNLKEIIAFKTFIVDIPDEIENLKHLENIIISSDTKYISKNVLKLKNLQYLGVQPKNKNEIEFIKQHLNFNKVNKTKSRGNALTLEYWEK